MKEQGVQVDVVRADAYRARGYDRDTPRKEAAAIKGRFFSMKKQRVQRRVLMVACCAEVFHELHKLSEAGVLSVGLRICIDDRQIEKQAANNHDAWERERLKKTDAAERGNAVRRPEPDVDDMCFFERMWSSYITHLHPLLPPLPFAPPLPPLPPPLHPLSASSVQCASGAAGSSSIGGSSAATSSAAPVVAAPAASHRTGEAAQKGPATSPLVVLDGKARPRDLCLRAWQDAAAALEWDLETCRGLGTFD
jgi:hypothetical protein